ncbi:MULTISPECIES: restriction endonuclease subunit S [Methanobrevibacter]|uniref:Type I restriction enzyme S subunit n=1 Tax=Methanobrevibacter gottschalkii DSM 11977 TaxID=1122229 RepID=A0A3N5B2K2_9EURY|nr:MULTISPECIES: restriction endonuclease subunit S [Methanobrevibacter]OEC94268.1 hypothetical protein A9505_08905 [Methanobrevibacter sp. A27]RPF51856.1 type I restriction enzyme S subunit [Methanobrevibacter gottschalkii DSM 11977]
MSEERLVPKLRFSGFSDVWESYKIGDISKTYSGGTPSTSKREYYEGDIPFIKSGEICKDKTEHYINEIAINNSSAKKIKKGDLLLALYGATSGEVAISKIDGAINQAVLKIDNNMDNYFQYNYFLKYKDKIVHKYIQGGQGNLSANIIKKLEFKFPKLDEQKRISQFLLLMDKKIDLLENKLQYYQDFKKYLMQRIFTQNLRFDFDNVKLKNISKINKGKQLNKDDMVETGIFHVLNGGKEPSGYTNAWNTPENTITISEGGNSCGYVNFNTEKFWSGGHCYYLDNLAEKVDGYYLYSYLKFIEPKIMRLRVGSGLPNIQKGDIENIKVKIALPTEQQRISNLLYSTDEKIINIANQKDNFELFKKGLLQQMFV